MSILTDIITNKEGLYTGDLKYYFKCLFNSRGANNPYHNIRHSCTVLVRCYEGLKYSQGILEKQVGLRYLKRLNRALLISAIFHDNEHPGKSGNDDLNIEMAVRSWKKLALKEDRDDETIFDYVINLIQSTEFGPNGHVMTVHGEYSKILRDADLTQICSDAWIRMILFGLSEEMGVAPIEMLRMQEGFLKNLKFESQWGQQFNGVIQEKIAEANELLRILE